MKTFATQIEIGVASDRAHAGTYRDVSWSAIKAYLDEVLASEWPSNYCLVPNEIEAIAGTLIDLVDKAHCDLVLMLGGTDPAPRDVTPEALALVVGRPLPWFGEEMRRASLRVVSTAILSRQDAELRGRCLVVSLPGKPSAIATCLDAVFTTAPYCLDLIGAARLERLKAFRPSPNL
jgi:molybdopterin adenylyltransferase